MPDPSESTETTTSRVMQVFNALAYISMAAWVVMVLFVGGALAEHKNEPHTGSVTIQAFSDTRLDVSRNTQMIASNERFAAAMRTQNAKDHLALANQLTEQRKVIDQIWAKINTP